MTDKLREKLCDDCGKPISICNALAMVKEAEKRHGADVVRAALAAAPQPTPVDAQAGGEMMGEWFWIRFNEGDQWQPARLAERERYYPATENGWFDAEEIWEIGPPVACSDLLAERDAAVDREALVAVIEKARERSTSSYAIADALLARGLRLPGRDETEPRRCAECTCEGGEHECNWIKPGPIRVVEGGE